jgi:hypothetical protein
MASKLVHWEICGPDAGALKEFYGDLFGWEFESPEGFGGYHMTSAEQTGLGGAVGEVNPSDTDLTAYVTVYLEVADIDAHLARIEAAGGRTVKPRTVIPGMVTYAMFGDPGGNLIGLVESAGE